MQYAVGSFGYVDVIDQGARKAADPIGIGQALYHRKSIDEDLVVYAGKSQDPEFLGVDDDIGGLGLYGGLCFEATGEVAAGGFAELGLGDLFGLDGCFVGEDHARFLGLYDHFSERFGLQGIRDGDILTRTDLVNWTLSEQLARY